MKESKIRTGFENEIIKSTKIKADSINTLSARRRVDSFDLPVGAMCFFNFDYTGESSLAFVVKEYTSEINFIFSTQNIFVYLEFADFVGSTPRRIIEYLEKEWNFDWTFPAFSISLQPGKKSGSRNKTSIINPVFLNEAGFFICSIISALFEMFRIW